MNEVELSRKAAAACLIGGAIGLGIPGLLPGVAVVCFILLTLDA
jgi:hypothetical protein